MIDPRWQRWIKTSVNKWFNDKWAAFVAADPSLTTVQIYYEGQDINLSGDEYYEVRTDGPRIEETSLQEACIYLLINVMITVQKGAKLYRIHDIAGYIQTIFSTIPVLSYGESSPPNLVTCLTRKGKLDTIDWGEMSVGSDLGGVLNISVEGNYEGVLTYGNH